MADPTTSPPLLLKDVQSSPLPTTPITNASIWESDSLFPISAAPASPLSPAISSHFWEPWNHPLMISQPPFVCETEAARADSPLLGFSGLADTDVMPATCGAKADVDKPLPLPPRPSVESEIADTTTLCPIEAPPPVSPGPMTERPRHSPSSSYSSNSSRRSRPDSVSQLPIGVGHPHVHKHPHSRTPSGGSANGVSGRASKIVLLVSSSPMLTPATRPTPQPSCSTRTRSQSNAVVSIKRFHLPTGMIRSQSHAQLRNEMLVQSRVASSHDAQASIGSSHGSVAHSLSFSGVGVAPRLARSVVTPSTSQTHLNTPSYGSASLASQPSHVRQTSEILDRLESRVPSLSSSFSRNAVYIDSEDISAKLDELLLLAREEVDRRVVEEAEDEDTVEAGEGGMIEREEWVDVNSHNRGSINQQIGSPPNSPASGYLSVTGSQAASSGGGAFYTSPEAGTSRVYLGSTPMSQNSSIELLSSKNLDMGADGQENLTPIRLPPAPFEITDPDATIGEVPQNETVDPLPAEDGPMHPPMPSETMEDEAVLEEVLALARDLAVDDRMVWGVRRSLEVFDDCWSEFEDEELGVGICDGVPRLTAGPYREGNLGVPQESHVRFTFDGDGLVIRDRGLAPPSASKWSLTSSIDEEKRTSLEGKPKKDKKRRSFVSFISSGDKEDKGSKDDGSFDKENGTVGKKRNRLASFISRLSSVGLGGSGSNTPSTRTPPVPTLSASSSSHASPALFSPPLPSKWDSPSMPALTPTFSATPSRSSSPTVLPDFPLLQRQPRVTIVADDDCSNSSPSSSRLILTSLNSTTCESVTPPASRPPTPPPQTIPLPVMTSGRRIPPGIVIPPLPTRPPPELPVVSFPLGKAPSEGMIGPHSPVHEDSLTRPRSNSTADLFGKHVTFSNFLPSSSSSREQISMTLPLRRSVLSKSASASVLGLHQQLKPSSLALADTAAGTYDDGLVPPTPTSMISTDEYGEARRQEDVYEDGLKRPRLRAMSSLGALPLNGTIGRSKGGLKSLVGRLTGLGKNSSKGSPAQLHIIPSFLGNGSSNRSTAFDPEAMTDPQKTPTPKHSPNASFSNGNTAGSSGGMLSGFKSYLERTPFRQT